MDKITRQFFQRFETFNPSQGLGDAVLKKIGRLRARRRHTVFLCALVSLFASFFGIVWSVSSFGGALFQSEFWSVASLFFSDFSIVSGHWRELSFLLLETFPAFVFSVLFGSFFILLMSAEQAMNRWEVSKVLSARNKYMTI